MVSKFIAVSAVASTMLVAGTAFGGCGEGSEGCIVVTNRDAGTISLIDTRQDEGSSTRALPSGPNTPEPMYVAYIPGTRTVLVGDRANNCVVAFDSRDFSLQTFIPAGKGVFHMWADESANQLWVNNDIDRTMSVIELSTFKPLTTVRMPPDLKRAGGKPHDVIIDPDGESAYVTFVNVSGDFDYVVQFSTRTFEEINRAPVGKDPHVSLTKANESLYVPTQGTGTVNVFDRESLDPVTAIDVPGAHGAGMAFCGDVLYTTNISGGGDSALWAIDTKINRLAAGPVDAPHATPHNLALVPDDSLIYVTHSGATSSKVSVFDTSAGPAGASLIGDIPVQTNPFGIAFVSFGSDLNDDGRIGADDLATLLGAWGTCEDGTCTADLDKSGEVDAADLAILLGNWTLAG